MDISTKDLAAAAVVYSHYRTDNNRATYIGPVHSDLSKDMLVVQSVSPKRNGVSYGNRRSLANLINSVSVLDTNGVSTTKDMKAEISVSIPAGVTLNDFKERIARLNGILDDATLVENLFFTGKID